jgi:hypothetical protein
MIQSATCRNVGALQYVIQSKQCGLFVLCDRQHDGDDHPTVFAPMNDALLGFSGLHRYGTDWAGFRRYKAIGLPLHATYLHSEWLMRI